MLRMNFETFREVNKLYEWKDQNKDIVRNNKYTPFEEGKVDFPSGLRLYFKCNLEENTIKLVVSLNNKECNTKYIEGVAQFNDFNYGYSLKKVYSYEQKKYVDKGQEIDRLVDLVTFVKSINAYSLYNNKEIKRHYAPKENISDNTEGGDSLDKKVSVHIRSLTRFINNNSELKQTLKSFNKAKRKSPSEPFEVRGYIRRYKNGKTIYVKPFMKCLGENKEEVKTQNVVYKL